MELSFAGRPVAKMVVVYSLCSLASGNISSYLSIAWALTDELGLKEFQYHLG